MKYTEETSIEEIADYALKHWGAFMQDVRDQKLRKWLKTDMHEEVLAQQMEEQLHSDWALLYPCLSTAKIFELLQTIGNVSDKGFLKSFMSNHKEQIEQERQKLHRLSNFAGGPTNTKSIIGFLLAFEDYEPTGVYFLYEGINTFGSGTYEEEPNFQRITTSEGMLSLKHFEVHADFSGNLTLHVLNGKTFVYESEKNFMEGRIDFGDTIVLGGLKLTFLQNINK